MANIQTLEKQFFDLKIAYEEYLRGVVKINPEAKRRELERTLQHLCRENHGAAESLKLKNMSNQLRVFKGRWDKQIKIKEKELMGSKRPVAKPSKPDDQALIFAQVESLLGSGNKSSKITAALHEKLSEARKKGAVGSPHVYVEQGKIKMKLKKV